MEILLNTLKYGDKKTKLRIIFAFLCLIGMIALLLLFFIMQNILCFFGSIICVFVAIYNFQKLGEENINHDPASRNNENLNYFDESNNKISSNTLKTNKDENTLEANSNEFKYLDDKVENDNKEDKSEKKVKKAKKVKKSKKREGENLKRRKEKKLKSEDNIKRNKTKIIKQKAITEIDKINNDEKEITKESIKKEDYLITSDENETNSYEIGEEEVINISADDVDIYTPKVFRKILKKYKVRRKHYAVIVDKCIKYKIKQCPAYIWLEKSCLKLLVIEQEPRVFEIPISTIRSITYLKKVEVDIFEDYRAFNRPSFLVKVFSKYLPDYIPSTVVGDETKYKNLYGIGPGIYFTNVSAIALFEIFDIPFEVEDKVTMSTKVNHYFKEIYKSGILLKDGIFEANKYADQVSIILNNMVTSSMSNLEYKETLQLLVRNKLITEEFSNYYMEQRNKI